MTARGATSLTVTLPDTMCFSLYAHDPLGTQYTPFKPFYQGLHNVFVQRMACPSTLKGLLDLDGDLQDYRDRCLECADEVNTPTVPVRDHTCMTLVAGTCHLFCVDE